ncbi:MAG: biopolymer transporter ExbD [Novosphingobium sp.]|uniref:ExbD/TolR family protein n=1 Tax=Novosphingobium sp. TaxID=1874826 RepID=UPI0017A0FF57|nr:biopolymer transporter ExbD [Novosphingobium sp.]
MGMGPAATRHTRRGRTPMADINVTPLVDVMLVLLIIFMVTAPLMSAGVPVDLPDSQARPLDQTPDPVNLSIAADGRVFLDKAEVDPGALGVRLAAIPRGADGKPPLVTLRADRSLDYGRVMEVMGALNHAGFNAISLVTNSSVSAP